MIPEKNFVSISYFNIIETFLPINNINEYWLSGFF